mgnify:CR=1 FL=1
MAKKEFKNPIDGMKKLFTKKSAATGEFIENDSAQENGKSHGKIELMSVKKVAGKIWSGYNFVFIFLVIFVIWLIITSGATTWNGVTNVLRHSTIIGMMAIGMGFVIITGGIDLSVGSNLALTGIISVQVFNDTGNAFATFVVAVLFGTMLGLFNGLLIGKAKMPAFIVTLATMLIYRSIAQYYLRASMGESIFSMDRNAEAFQSMFREFGNGDLLTIPWVGIILIAVTLIFVFVSNRTKYGKSVYAVGSNEKAAYLSGVKVEWVRVSVYTITGALVGFAAFLWLSMYGSVDPATIGKNNEMYAIAAVVIGGISMAGGKGKILGVLFGAMSYTVIDKIIAALGVDSLINDTIKGAILLAAVFLQLVGPMLRGVKLGEQIKEITSKWLSFGKSKKALLAEGADGGDAEVATGSSDDAVTEAEEAAERAVEEVLDGHDSPEAAAKAAETAERADAAAERGENPPEE